MARQGEPYWTGVRVALEILEPGEAVPRLVALARPFGIIGRFPDSDLRLDDRAVSARHAYLHVDARGLFVVDLATRNGIQFEDRAAPCGWLRPGEAFEIAGWPIRVASMHEAGHPITPPTFTGNPLADSGDIPLCELALEPVGQRGVSWSIGSELIFVGRGDSCGIRLNQANVARTHCALFRTPNAVFIISLPGQSTLVNGQTARDAIALDDGDIITIGQARFVAKINAPQALSQSRELERIPPTAPTKTAYLPATLKDFGELPGLNGGPSPLELIPPESREAVLGWMLGTLHAGQTEILRRQDELQQSVALILQHLQADTSKRLDSQADRIEALAGELARLAARPTLPSTSPSLSIPQFAPEEPRRPARALPPAPEIDPARSLETAAWLLERIDRVGNENKFSFRSLLSRRPPRTGEEPPGSGTNPSTQLPGSEPDRGDGGDRA
jgi:pSer/pThr/pTyr-binding forkhead associated (FHA) protein